MNFWHLKTAELEAEKKWQKTKDSISKTIIITTLNIKTNISPSKQIENITPFFIEDDWWNEKHETKKKT